MMATGKCSALVYMSLYLYWSYFATELPVKRHSFLAFVYNSVLLCRSLYIRLLEKQESGKIKQKVKPVLVDSRNVKVIHRDCLS